MCEQSPDTYLGQISCSVEHIILSTRGFEPTLQYILRYCQNVSCLMRSLYVRLRCLHEVEYHVSMSKFRVCNLLNGVELFLKSSAIKFYSGSVAAESSTLLLLCSEKDNYFLKFLLPGFDICSSGYIAKVVINYITYYW